MKWTISLILIFEILGWIAMTGYGTPTDLSNTVYIYLAVFGFFVGVILDAVQWGYNAGKK